MPSHLGSVHGIVYIGVGDGAHSDMAPIPVAHLICTGHISYTIRLTVYRRMKYLIRVADLNSTLEDRGQALD